MPGLVETNQVGKREMLADLITVADAKEKPFLAMVKKGKKPTNMLMQWQGDKYAAVDLSGVADGVDVTDYENAGENRKLIMNYCQRKWRKAKVGVIAEEVSDVAGAPEGEMARSLDKKTEELSRDMEATLCSDNDAQLETDDQHPYKTRGLGSWLQNGAQTTLPVDATFRTPTASINATATASLAEDTHVRPVLKSIYTEYGKGEQLTLLCGTALKEAFTNFTRFNSGATNTYGTVRAYNAELDGGKITTNITLYEGDFNKVALVPSLLLAAGSAAAVQAARGYVLPMDAVELRWHTMPRIKKLPDMGGGPRALIEAIFGLVYYNPLRGGKFAATS